MFKFEMKDNEVLESRESQNMLELSVVKFLCDDKISHVPTTWLSNFQEDTALCYWPPKNAGKHIISQSVLDHATWSHLKVAVLKQTESYKIAREYLRLLSEGESAPESFLSKPLGKGQRKRKRPLTYDSDGGSGEEVLSITPPPPPLLPLPHPGLLLPQPKLLLSRPITSSQPPVVVKTKNAVDTTEYPIQQNMPKSIEPDSKSIYNKSTVIQRTVSTEVETLINTLTSPEDHNANKTAIQNGNNTSKDCCNRAIEESGILKLILSNVITIKKMIEQQQEQQHTRFNPVTENVELHLIPKKPFNKFKKLENFDARIKNDDDVCRQNELAFFLLGGISPKEMIRRGLKTIFSDQLAMRCSWTGRKNDFALHNLKIMEVLKATVRKRFGVVTDSDIQSEVSLWFRQSKLRFDRAQLKEIQEENREDT